MDLAVTLSEFNLEAENKGEGEGNLPSGGEKGALKGLSVQALTPDLRQQLQTPEGTQGVVITDVDPDSAASAAGLQQGDIIVQVDRKPVANGPRIQRCRESGCLPRIHSFAGETRPRHAVCCSSEQVSGSAGRVKV